MTQYIHKIFDPDRCRCGSGLWKRDLIDARGIFCTYVCDACEKQKRAEFNSEIFTDCDYWADEPIEGDGQ